MVRKFSVDYGHVHGHQKEQNPNTPLDACAILNNKMDGLAKAYLHSSLSLELLDQIIDNNEWALWILVGQKIVSDLKYHLAQAICRQLVIQEWSQPLMKYGAN